ncbi:MAG: hypothetical protein ABIZ80_06745 [Bryobacteraceae bacterium]
MIWAILRAQFLSMHSFRLGSGRRGAIFSTITSLLWYGFWAVAAVGAAAFAEDPDLREKIRQFFPSILIFVILYWQLAPILVASLGASLDLRKLLVYPVPAARLFWVEVILRLTTGMEMVIILTGLSFGLARNPQHGGWTKFPQVALPVLAFILFNLLLAAGLRNFVERLLSRRRMREIFVIFIVMIGAVPQMLVVTGVPRGTLQRLTGGQYNPLWLPVAVSNMIFAGLSVAPCLIVAVWIGCAFWFGRWQFERSLRFDTQAAQATIISPAGSKAPRNESLYRLPGMFLPDPLAAMVEKELRTLSRTPRFRLVFLMGFTFGLIVWLPLIFGNRPAQPSPAVNNFLTLVCVYALALLGQVTYWNAFGFDRSATQGYFSWPVSMAKVFVAKNLAAGIFILLEICIVAVACILLRMQPAPHKMLEAFLVTPVVALYLMAAGNLSSVHLPRPMSAERVAQGGSAGRSQAYMLFVYPLALLPVLLAYFARYAFGGQAAFYIVLIFAAGLGLTVYWVALDSAVKASDRRREEMITELSRADGPVAVE